MTPVNHVVYQYFGKRCKYISKWTVTLSGVHTIRLMSFSDMPISSPFLSPFSACYRGDPSTPCHPSTHSPSHSRPSIHYPPIHPISLAPFLSPRYPTAFTSTRSPLHTCTLPCPPPLRILARTPTQRDQNLNYEDTCTKRQIPYGFSLAEMMASASGCCASN